MTQPTPEQPAPPSVIPPRPVRPAPDVVQESPADDPITLAMRAAAAQRQQQQPQQVLLPPQVAPFAVQPVGMDGAVGSMLKALLNQQLAPGMQFYVVRVPEIGVPQVSGYLTIDELRSAIQQLLGGDSYVYCFLGHRLPMTRGPFPFLQTPYGSIPIKDAVAPDTATDSDGWMGEEMPMNEVSQPTQEAEPEDEGSEWDPEPDAMEEFDGLAADETELF